MADAFAALWDSSVPAKSDPPPQKLGSAIPPQKNARKLQQDAFTLLAASSAPNSRPLTPASTGQKPPVKPPLSKTSGDAFSDLLTSSLGGGSDNGSKMTISERATLVEKAQRENMQKRQQAAKMPPSAWDGLDMLATSSSVKPYNVVGDDFGFGLAEPTNPLANDRSMVNQGPPQDDDWGLFEFSSGSGAASSSHQTPHSQAILDLDDLSSLPTPTPGPPPAIQEPVLRLDSPEYLDSGEVGDRLLDAESQDDDILGELSKPVDAIPKRALSANTSNRTSPSPQPSNPTSRPVSPPPHVLGQIVEMGFSVEQARVALATTSTGLDVQAALETLLSNGVGSEPLPPDQPRDYGDEVDSRKRPSRGALHTGTPSLRDRLNRNTPSPSSSQQEKNTQAEKLLSQASEIGLSVFNRANAFWNQSKEKVQKAYEERAKGNQNTDPTQPIRPRWMQDNAAHGDDAEDAWEHKDTSFSDEVLQPQPTRPVTRTVEPQHKPKAADVAAEEPEIYVSPFRRGRPSQAKPAEVPRLNASSSSKPPTRASTPITLIQRQAVSASQSLITSSFKHKTTATDKFKLGQYVEAEAAYTAAISALPQSHLLLVPLYNNRALTRIKTGDCTGAVEDCNIVISLIGPTYHPSREAKVTNESEGAGVDLADGLIKAWKRRAEANEAREKWALAQTDWETVAASEWAAPSMRAEGVRGAGRCRRMVTVRSGDSENSSSTGPTSVKPQVKRPLARAPVRKVTTPPSEALNKLREANKAAEAEERARDELKDTVDERLVAWKGGKETNIRALIASLDSVLWPELGWQKVGMSELVTPSQVKIRYTKAIAKLHPDKLNVGNTTVEQRMIANGVFGVLNEAWNTFKQ